MDTPIFLMESKMKFEVSKEYTLLILSLVTLILLGVYAQIDLWILIMMCTYLIMFTCHEFVHAAVAMLYGVEVVKIELKFGKCICWTRNTKDTTFRAFSHTIISGFIFNLLCVSTTTIYLLMVGFSNGGIIPLAFSCVLPVNLITNTAINEECDLRKYIKYKQEYYQKRIERS